MDDFMKQINELVDQLNDETGSDEVDSVQLFIDQHLKYKPGSSVTLGLTHRSYLAFCIQYSYVGLPMRWFPEQLREKGLVVSLGRGNKHFVRDRELVL